MLTILLAIVGMALKDALSTTLVVAESKGRAKLAGLMDGLGDLAGILVTYVGAGQVIEHGLTVHTALVLIALFITSVLGTAYWTAFNARHGGDPTGERLDAIERRLSFLEPWPPRVRASS